MASLAESKPARKYLTCAETAKLIRGALKREYPGVQFSVRSKTYSMGASISVSWIDGPRQKEVEAVAGAFAGGGFDGMIDLAYSVDHWLLPDGSVADAHSPGTTGSMGVHESYDHATPHPDAELVSFGADHVFCNRSYSSDFEARVIKAVEAYFGKPFDPKGRYHDDWGSSVVWKFAEGHYPYEGQVA